MKHGLANDTLYIEKGGIIGRCVCGWDTGHRFSSVIASVAFQDHIDSEADRSSRKTDDENKGQP